METQNANAFVMTALYLATKLWPVTLFKQAFENGFCVPRVNYSPQGR